MTVNDLKEADEQLRAEWFASYANPKIDFIYDGATYPTQWLSSPWRIMCLLKEAHGGGQWNHAKGIYNDNGLLRVGGSANQALHYRMVEWLYAVESTLMGAPFNIDSDRAEDYKHARITMLRSAWVNIKKANGVAYSDNNDLRAVVKRDADFLKRQLKLLSPRIIVCGRTFGLVRDTLFPASQKITGAAFSYSTADGVIIMDYYHPARKPRYSYWQLAEEIKRILAAKPHNMRINTDESQGSAGQTAENCV